MGYKFRTTQKTGSAEGLGMRGQRRPSLSCLIYIPDSKTNVKDHLGPRKIPSIPKIKKRYSFFSGGSG